MNKRSVGFFQNKILRFVVDFNALSEINVFLQGDIFLQTFVSMAKLLKDVQKRLCHDFGRQLSQQDDHYAFEEKDYYECRRDLAFYAQISKSAQDVLTRKEVTSNNLAIFSGVRNGLIQDGFSAKTSDLILYLLLQTREGIPNVFCGGLQRAVLALFDPFAYGFNGGHDTDRELHVYENRNGEIYIVIKQDVRAKNDSGEISYIMQCRVELQVDSDLRILAKTASFSVSNASIVNVVYQQLVTRGFVGRNGGREITFNLDREKINALIKTWNSVVDRTFMELLRLYASPERENYLSNLSHGRNGVLGLCLDLIQIGIQCNYELEIFLFALDKLLDLLKNTPEEKFNKHLVSPQFLALSHFNDDINALVLNHEDQFISYLSSLEFDDITEKNIDTIALILVQLFLSRKGVNIAEIFQCLNCHPKLIERFLLKLNNNVEVYGEFKICLEELRSVKTDVEQYWDVLSNMVQKLSQDDIITMFAYQTQRIAAIEALIQDILITVKNVILASDKVSSKLSLEWNNVVMDWLERELRSRFKEQVEISPLFLQLLVLPYNLTDETCRVLTQVILEKIDVFRHENPILAQKVQTTQLLVEFGSMSLTP